ncbi:hypothetical protein HYX08_01825 [Candidatus Woesearchaeota archaeon]|nr:hypothetical protein [Candidatus Woesearchaeota archaeon]
MNKIVRPLAAIVFAVSIGGCATFNCEEKARDIARIFQNDGAGDISNKVSINGLPVPIRSESYARCVNRQLERLYGKKYRLMPNTLGSHTAYEFY